MLFPEMITNAHQVLPKQDSNDTEICTVSKHSTFSSVIHNLAQILQE